MAVIIAAIGISGSGKTTTLEYLISHLNNENCRIGVIKHIHQQNFTMDKEGTNTWRFSKAGSKITVAISPEEIAIIEKTSNSLNDLDKIIKFLENEKLDIIFIEGFKGEISKRQEIRKIITAKTSEDLQKTLDNTVPPILAISGLIAKTEQAKTEQPSSDIPYINLPDEGPKLLEIVRNQLKTEQN
jgi:molybdopterin-guanine dinucleotide biosynthesis adapter protein